MAVIRQVIETVMQTGTRMVEKVVPVVRQVTDYVTQQVEESYQVARVVGGVGWPTKIISERSKEISSSTETILNYSQTIGTIVKQVIVTTVDETKTCFNNGGVQECLSSCGVAADVSGVGAPVGMICDGVNSPWSDPGLLSDL